eukprot:1183476-Prorocentrum_minimum.AAC.2
MEVEALCRVLQQFLDPAVDMIQKKTLEEQLITMRESSLSTWRRPYLWLTHESQVPHVQWFAGSTLEKYVLSHWERVDEAERAAMRDNLLQYLLQRHASLPQFVSTKVAKVIIDIGKFDWPQRYPELLPRIHSAITQGNIAEVMQRHRFF